MYLTKIKLRAMLVFFLAHCVAGSVYANSVAGKVTFIIGDSKVLSNDGLKNIAVGDSVLVGQTLQSGSNGHIHLRMIDGAFISVRPNSKLHIVDYLYDEKVPSKSNIKFNLERGVARSITGKAGEKSKEIFRMNTPLAAIGIRGTDFVVQADNDVTRVAVQSGSIVVAPLSVECAASGFGPCNTAAARVLTSAMSSGYLELKGISPIPVFVPHSNGANPTNSMSPDTISPPRIEEPKVNLDTSKKSTSITVPVNKIDLPNIKVPEKQPEPVIDLTPQFWWGRYSKFVENDKQNSVTAAYHESREIVGGGSEVYALFRERGEVNIPHSGRVAFKLADGDVSILTNENKLLPALIASPSLAVDFSQRTYQTSLTVNSQGLESVPVHSNGIIDFQGTMVQQSASDGTMIQGGLSKSGEQIGYLFKRQMQFGTIYGVTRWTK